MLDDTLPALLVLWCSFAFTGTIVAITAVFLAFGNKSAGLVIGIVVFAFGFGSLIGSVSTLPRFWWIAVLPLYLGVETVRVWTRKSAEKTGFYRFTLLKVVGVTALILAGITMQWREYDRQQNLAKRISKFDGHITTGLGSIRGITFGQITDTGLQNLKQDLESIRELTRLQVSGRQITDAGLEHLSGLTPLRELYLQNTQVTDAGLSHLKRLGSLKSLDLMGTYITDGGLSHLAGMKNLKRVWLSNPPITDAGVNQLQKLLPMAEISN